MLIIFFKSGKKMKKYALTLITATVIQFFNCYSVMETYEMTLDIISTNTTERFPAYMITDQQPYVNGGLVFTYPAGLFTSNPTISLTIDAPLHASNITYTVEVCLESSTSATVMAYENNSGVLTEAPTSSINIHFIAIGT